MSACASKLSESDDLAIEVLLELMNGIESGIEAARQRVRERKRLDEKDSGKKTYDPEKVVWAQATGSHGPFERATAHGTTQPPDFDALVDDLKIHNGALTNTGLFYWLFNEPPVTVGRKPARK